MAERCFCQLFGASRFTNPTSVCMQVLPLAEAAPVDYFTKDLWATALPEKWGNVLFSLDEHQLAG